MATDALGLGLALLLFGVGGYVLIEAARRLSLDPPSCCRCEVSRNVGMPFC